jgi:hypothetical protein
MTKAHFGTLTVIDRSYAQGSRTECLQADQPGQKPLLTCTFGVEVSGLEPPASTLRK